MRGQIIQFQPRASPRPAPADFDLALSAQLDRVLIAIEELRACKHDLEKYIPEEARWAKN
ncbi:MAG: hypothetical protein Q8R28_01405 [Dehalococcoidia bacterium]|nr:hypothetical protein [Dehalococcoidia bacterium]